MKNRLAARCAALLLPSSLFTSLFTSLLIQAPAFAQQGPAPERKGGAPMHGWQHGAGGWGAMGGWGVGMMGSGYGALDLTRDQQDKLHAIHRALRDKQFALMDRLHDSMRSATFYRGGQFDEQSARNAYAQAEKIHRQMFENRLAAQKQADALLTPQQRQQLSQVRR